MCKYICRKLVNAKGIVSNNKNEANWRTHKKVFIFLLSEVADSPPLPLLLAGVSHLTIPLWKVHIWKRNCEACVHIIRCGDLAYHINCWLYIHSKAIAFQGVHMEMNICVIIILEAMVSCCVCTKQNTCVCDHHMWWFTSGFLLPKQKCLPA